MQRLGNPKMSPVHPGALYKMYMLLRIVDS